MSSPALRERRKLLAAAIVKCDEQHRDHEVSLRADYGESRRITATNMLEIREPEGTTTKNRSRRIVTSSQFLDCPAHRLFGSSGRLFKPRRRTICTRTRTPQGSTSYAIAKMRNRKCAEPQQQSVQTPKAAPARICPSAATATPITRSTQSSSSTKSALPSSRARQQSRSARARAIQRLHAVRYGASTQRPPHSLLHFYTIKETTRALRVQEAQGSVFRDKENGSDSRNAFGFHCHAAFRSARSRRRRGTLHLSRLRLVLTTMQSSVWKRLAQRRNHRMIHHTCRALRVIVRFRIQLAKPARIPQRRAAKSLLGRPAQRALSLGLFAMPPLHQNPLRNARLHIHFDQFIENFDHLFPQVRAVIQAGQLEGLQRSLRAARNVLQHHFRRLHDASPCFKLAGNLPRDVQHTVIIAEVNGQSALAWDDSNCLEVRRAASGAGENLSEELNARQATQ